MRIVLVRPRDPNNIGAVARAMANFALSDLVVVSPHPPIWDEVRSAIGADAVLGAARVVETLGAAVADRTLVAGTTAGTRRTLPSLVGPETFVAEARRTDTLARAALVFGNEKHGLTNEDFTHCNRFVRIATASAQPSLNLAHAVAICCYEVSRADDGSRTDDNFARRPRASARARVASVDSLASSIAAVVTVQRGEAAGRRAAATLRDLLRRADARERDVAFLRGLCGAPPVDP